MRWLFEHPAGWFFTVMTLWCSIWLFGAALGRLSCNEADEPGDKDDQEGSG